MNVGGYSYVLSAAAFEHWRDLPTTEQDKLVDRFNWLAAHPFYESAITDYDTAGRKVSLTPCGDYVVVHCTDHGSREVRINEIAGD